ncbi:uncharacterized protein LOC141525115 isoform X1 [Cotesia typhae]|uniref:uncharacterized protein LOC141525115 isoform X1 n=2 Tax=Cotesia typhae TaxID=2053667 RepID=UPI003D69F686
MIIVRTKCRCSSACSGVSLPDEQYKKQMNLFRCFACRQLRRKLQNRSYKVKPDIKSSYTDLKYQESLKTKQIQRLKRKVGTLLIDEVALSEAVKLNRRTMQLDGFVDLGAHTPENLINSRADHALVFMYQPFQGNWVQVVGSFLSRNSVTSAILHKLLIECIVLLENAGFYVDVVTSDAAQWNRGAWTLFGFKDGQCSCDHPCNFDRRLWFISDFPHLIKCFRNKIMKRLFFWTPDGFVRKSH